MSTTPQTTIETELQLARERIEILLMEAQADKARIQELISERDSARLQADQKWNLRRELVDELGGEDPAAAVMKIRELKARVRELEEWIMGLEMTDQRFEKPQYCRYKGPAKPEGLR